MATLKEILLPRPPPGLKPKKIVVEERSFPDSNPNAVVGNAELALAYFLLDSAALTVRHKIVVDLSSGTGVVGLIAAAAGAKFVFLTDLPSSLQRQRQDLSLLNSNLQRQDRSMCLPKKVTAQVLRWGRTKRRNTESQWRHLFEEARGLAGPSSAEDPGERRRTAAEVVILFGGCLFSKFHVTLLLDTLRILATANAYARNASRSHGVASPTSCTTTTKVFFAHEIRSEGGSKGMEELFLAKLEKGLQSSGLCLTANKRLVAKEQRIPERQLREEFCSEDISVWELELVVRVGGSTLTPPPPAGVGKPNLQHIERAFNFAPRGSGRSKMGPRHRLENSETNFLDWRIRSLLRYKSKSTTDAAMRVMQTCYDSYPDTTRLAAALITLEKLERSRLSPNYNFLHQRGEEDEDTAWLLATEAADFLSEKGRGKRFCVLEAKTDNIIAATPEWMEATGLTWVDILRANAKSGSGIRRAVTDSDARGHGEPAERAGHSHVGARGERSDAPAANSSTKPPDLVKFLKTPDDWKPGKVTASRSASHHEQPAPRLFRNLAVTNCVETLGSRPVVVPFHKQWHKEGRYFYTGFTAISTLLCRNEDGTGVAARLLDLRETRRECS